MEADPEIFNREGANTFFKKGPGCPHTNKGGGKNKGGMSGPDPGYVKRGGRVADITRK